MIDVKAVVKRVLAEHLGINITEVHDDSRIVMDLGADSLDQIEILMILEEDFEMNIPDEDLERWNTVQDVADYITARLAHEAGRV